MPQQLPSDGPPETAAPTPSVRRISNPRPRKTAVKAAIGAEAAPPEVPPVVVSVPVVHEAPPSAPAPPAAPAPVSQEVESDRDDAPDGGGDDWPEPDAPTHPGQESKRKRRRRKGKGQGQNPAANAPFGGPSGTEETHSLVDPSGAPPTEGHRPPRPSPAPNPPRPPQPRLKVDPEALTTKAWKIYLAEVSEEGVALIGDQDARELARRCFRLAEIFIEEQARRVPGSI